MQADDTQAAPARIVPIGGIRPAGAQSVGANALAAVACDDSLGIMQETLAIDDELASIERALHDEAVGVDELIATCLDAWSRIKRLHQRADVGKP